MDMSPSTFVSWGVAFAGYLVLVRCLRWRRYNSIHRKFQGRDMETLTPLEAQEIMLVSFHYDMPNLLTYSLDFALFKTYGIPTISDLLCKTGELKNIGTVSKRYTDTQVLIGSFMNCPFAHLGQNSENGVKTGDDPRGAIALARMNWLHSKYKTIKNEDYLYTLALFILEPPKWAALWGWRPLSSLEAQAFYIFWRDIGHQMGIKDIPTTLEGLQAWSEEYEREIMVPAQSNNDVAHATTEELLDFLPDTLGLKAFGRRIVYSILEERVRVAMMFPQQPPAISIFVHVTLNIFALFQRHLCLPRRKPRLYVPVGSEENVSKDGPLPRMHPYWFSARPWYKPEPTGVWRLWEKLSVSLGIVSQDAVAGPQLRSHGYRLEEIGPLHFEQQGHQEVMHEAERLRGCPISGPWARPPQSYEAQGKH